MEQEEVQEIAQGWQARTAGLDLLFAAGKRPDKAAIRQFAAAHPALALSHDPDQASHLRLVGDGHAAAKAVSSDEHWVELLRDGLTFELRGLQPRQSAAFPDIETLYDLDRAPNSISHDAVRLEPGPYIAGGAYTLPVMRGLAAIARDLAEGMADLRAVAWAPARTAIGPKFFESTISEWLVGGPFPALGLTAFGETIDGGLQSTGLAYWTGQELRIEPPLAHDKVAATRLAVRLINQLVANGRLAHDEEIVAPDGARLFLRLSANRKFVRVANE